MYYGGLPSLLWRVSTLEDTISTDEGYSGLLGIPSVHWRMFSIVEDTIQYCWGCSVLCSSDYVVQVEYKATVCFQRGTLAHSEKIVSYAVVFDLKRLCNRNHSFENYCDCSICDGFEPMPAIFSTTKQPNTRRVSHCTQIKQKSSLVNRKFIWCSQL